MKHFNHSATTRTMRTEPSWLPVGAQIARLANSWSGRTDLVAFIGEGATEGLAPALFKPEIAEIEINIEQAFGFGVKPEELDLEKRSTQYEFPRGVGAIMHEAFHARFSRWDIRKAHEDLEKDEAAALMLLEESRIEATGLRIYPKQRVFLRASAMELALGEINEDSFKNVTAQLAGNLVGLIEARVTAGVLDEEEVREVLQTAKEVLGADNYYRLSKIAEEYQQHSNHWNVEVCYPLAVEWAKIVREVAEERNEQQDESGEGEGEGGSEGTSVSKELADLLGKLSEAASDIEIQNITELYDQERAENWQEEVNQRNSQKHQQDKNKQVSSEVFGKGTGEVESTSSSSRLIEQRPPTSSERISAVTISRMLEKAKYRERDITEVSSRVPQGKLNTRAAVQNSAQKAQGLLPTSEEWSRKVRKQTDEPTLKVGVMVDISGSMSSAMQPMATTAWVMSEAVRRVQGKCAMVYYGEDVFATLKAGEHLTSVNVFSAPDGTEKFDKAFRALDGQLNLLYGNGARLLVVVSDGVYTGTETTYAAKWMQQCKANGVGVLWLTFTPHHGANQICKNSNAVLISGSLNPTEAASQIGTACARALENITR